MTKSDFATFDSAVDLNQPFQAEVPDSDEEGNRYVIGDQLYNHEMYGSLRKGGAVDWYSMECLGLAAATFTSMFSYQSLLTVLQPMMNTQFNLTKQEATAVYRLVQMPMALSFLFGLLSDCYPIMGLRRKGYMILGCLINAVSIFIIGGLSAHFESQTDADDRSSTLIAIAIIMSGFASIGCIITYLCVHTRVIELSQRESLRDRGSIQASYLIFRRYVSLLCTLFALSTVGTKATPHVSLSTSMIILGIISLLPLVLVLRYWKEEVYSLNTSMKIRGQIFWKIMQQKAVWRIMAFIFFFTLFLGIKFNDSTGVIRTWAGAATDNSLLVKSINDVVMMLTMYVWRYFFMNRLWPTFFGMAPALQILPHLLIACLVTFDAVRDRYLYRTVFSMTAIADGIGLLNTIVPVTEIVQEGSEGALVGLTLTLQRCVNIFVDTNSVGLFRGDNFYTLSEVKLDTSDVHWDVLLSLVLNFGINALAWFGLFFLPSQKLDAQQLRMYGGFTKAASGVIIALCLSFFIYGLTVTLLTFIPGASCFRLVGGAGCS